MSAYTVDILHSKSAEVTAASSYVKCSLVSLILCPRTLRGFYFFLFSCVFAFSSDIPYCGLLIRALKGTILALAVSGILPAIDRIGLLATNALMAVVSWVFYG